MIKIRAFQFTDRYELEKLIIEKYEELKVTPPNSEKISIAIGFYASFSQCGKIYMINNNTDLIGYFIVENEWNMYEAKILYFIKDFYVNKNFRKFKPEVKAIEHLIKQEKICGIKMKLDKYISKKVFKFFNFERDFGPYLFKKIEE